MKETVKNDNVTRLVEVINNLNAPHKVFSHGIDCTTTQTIKGLDLPKITDSQGHEYDTCVNVEVHNGKVIISLGFDTPKMYSYYPEFNEFINDIANRTPQNKMMEKYPNMEVLCENSINYEFCGYMVYTNAINKATLRMYITKILYDITTQIVKYNENKFAWITARRMIN